MAHHNENDKSEIGPKLGNQDMTSNTESTQVTNRHKVLQKIISAISFMQTQRMENNPSPTIKDFLALHQKNIILRQQIDLVQKIISLYSDDSPDAEYPTNMIRTNKSK